MKIQTKYIFKAIGLGYTGVIFYIMGSTDFFHWPSPLESSKEFFVFVLGLNLWMVFLSFIILDVNKPDDLFVSKVFLVPATSLMILGSVWSLEKHGWESHAFWDLLKYCLGLVLIYYCRWSTINEKWSPYKWDFPTILMIVLILLGYFLPQIYFRA